MKTSTKVIIALVILLGVVYVFYIKPVIIDSKIVNNSTTIDSLENVSKRKDAIIEGLYGEISKIDAIQYEIDKEAKRLAKLYNKSMIENSNLSQQLKDINNAIISDSVRTLFFHDFFESQ